MMRPQMLMRRSTVAMSRAEFHAHQIQYAMPHAALGDHSLRKLADEFYRTLEHNGLNALIVIQVSTHCGDREVVVSMLDACQPPGQLTFMMIVDIREVGDAGAAVIVFFGTLLQLCAQEVAHGLASVGVTALRYQRIECRGEVFVERYRKSIHCQTRGL